jgi:hypothetical protein
VGRCKPEPGEMDDRLAPRAVIEWVVRKVDGQTEGMAGSMLAWVLGAVEDRASFDGFWC